MWGRCLSASTLFWATATWALAAPSPGCSTDPAGFDPRDILHRDVAVVGGGSSGTYTAVRLRDHGKSIVVVEPQGHLGGHAETWADPATGYTVDIGVIILAPVPVVTDYFARFRVPLVNFTTEQSVPTVPVDFTTGRIITDVAPPNADEVATAIRAFAALSQKYPQLQQSFNLTYPVDPELLLPFGEFVAKHNLGAMMQQVFAYQQGYAPLLHISTLRPFRASGYYTGLLNNTGVGARGLMGMGGADRPYRLPALPGLYNMQWNGGANLTQVYYGSPDMIGGAAVRAAVLADLNRYKAANGLPVAPDPDWVIFSDHAPFNMVVSNEDIKDRFYEKLFGLQGKRGTFYNGAVWLSHDSSALWQFTENYVLPALLASL